MSKPSRRKVRTTGDNDCSVINKKEYHRRYHVKNRDKIISRVQKWYWDNREERLAYGKKWRLENADKMVLYRKRSVDKLRMETFNAYGGPICRCCGVDIMQFLSIDHIDGGGADHRRSINNRSGKSFYSWLRKNNYPHGYQVLCMNCNFAKGMYGSCPHNHTFS